MQCIEHGRSEDYIWQVVSDTFCNKATATLRARSASLLAFGRWKKTAIGMDHQGIFPISEVMAYDYLCDLRRLRAAPSKGKRFLEAVGFSKGLLGASVDEVLKSARVKGVATCGNSTVPVKKIPLTVQQLIFLEKLAMIGHGQESVFAGYICFIVHCRLRWSDGQHCIKEPVLDVHEGRGFLEAALYHHKTAQKRRTRVIGWSHPRCVRLQLGAALVEQTERTWPQCIASSTSDASSNVGRRMGKAAFVLLRG